MPQCQTHHPKESVSPMLTHINRLPRPTATTIIPAANTLAEIGRKLSERLVIRSTQHNNVRTILVNKCEGVLGLCFLHSVGYYDSTLLRETWRSL